MDIVKTAKSVLIDEANAICELAEKIDTTFISACELILNCSGKVIVTGIGKSGIIGKKIAATFASTGTPAFFIHPTEASHGDLGMISSIDLVLAISNSGETDELLEIIPVIKRMSVRLIGMTSKNDSTIALYSDIHINVGVSKEACPLGLAPTSSTTATLAMGDALAISVLLQRDFTPEDFARSHPSGTLGKRLLIKISDLMKSGDAIPKVKPDDTLRNSIVEITNKRLGMTAVLDSQDNIVGILTDGDLRRAIENNLDFNNTLISAIMTKEPIQLRQEQLAVEALQAMEVKNITSILVTNELGKLVGVIHITDLINSKII